MFIWSGHNDLRVKITQPLRLINNGKVSAISQNYFSPQCSNTGKSWIFIANLIIIISDRYMLSNGINLKKENFCRKLFTQEDRDLPNPRGQPFSFWNPSYTRWVLSPSFYLYCIYNYVLTTVKLMRASSNL